MGKLKEKFIEIKNNPEVDFKEQVGYVSGVFGNCMGQDSVSTYTDQFMYDYMGLESRHLVAMKTATTGLNIVIAPSSVLFLTETARERVMQEAL